MSKGYGDELAREVDLRIANAVASTTALEALPRSVRVDKMLVPIDSATPQLAYFQADSVAVKDGVKVFVPDDIEASAAYVADPTTAPGRYHILAAVRPIDVMEFQNPAAASAVGLRAATASVAAASTATLLSAGTDELDVAARQIVFTTAGTTPADAPATAVITGQDWEGNVQTETVTLAQTATTATSTKCFRGTDLEITFPAGDGTGATIAIGWGAKLGLKFKPKVRQGSVMVVQEYEAGSRVVTGTFVIPATEGPFGTYSPSNAANGSRDYVLFVERDYA